MNTVSDKIKKMREFRNYTQEYMAKQLGITQAGYSKIENGNSEIVFSRIKEIADILGVTPEELISFDGQKYFNSFNNVKGSNNGSVVINMESEEVKKLYESKINLLQKLLNNTENELEKYKRKFGEI